MEHKELTYGIVGCGSFGGGHIRILSQMRGAKIISLCDKYIEKAEELKKMFNIDSAVCYNDYNKFLKENKPDIVVVATSDQEHRKITCAALEAGCNVMCEKPMALVAEDCKAMLESEKESGKLLMVGQIGRCTPGFIKAKEIVDSGLIGELYFVESEYAHDYMQKRGTDDWRVHPDREPVIGGACHAIDLLRWIAGDPTEATAYSTHKLLKDWPVPDSTIAIMKFPNDVIGKVFASISCKREYTMRTVLYGTKGTVVVNNTDPDLTLYLENCGENGNSVFASDDFQEEQTIKHIIRVSIDNHNIEAEHKAMRAAVLEGKALTTSGIEGAKTVAVCRAVVESAKCGKPVVVDYNFLMI